MGIHYGWVLKGDIQYHPSEKEENMAKMTGGQIVAECFEKLGIEYYFGYNGHGIWNILNALVAE